ncbi:MAG: sugar ABC transporter ATP-binding protein [Verrucomicrobiales bacterium]|nr:sugar ABC transporter ATP-binding protein [Verrucomicrobiales bacterium]MCP5526851.1 sugar ABC transporter ATP-binding protein [Verrucomicrobiales bacterium]
MSRPRPGPAIQPETGLPVSPSPCVVPPVGSQSHPPVLRLAGLGKTYAAPVLRAVDLEVFAGEVHALVGENGAGKSTLCRIAAGLTRPDAGTLELAGHPFRPRSRKEAERQGVSMVLQELNLLPTLSVAENIFFDELPHRWGWIDYARLNQQATAALERLGLPDLDPARAVGELGIGEQQLVEIATGLRRECRVLILDEPTAALTDPEIALLFQQIREFRTRGGAVLYISHRLEEIRQIADRVSVLRDGQLVATRPGRSLSADELVRLMVGRELPASLRPQPGPDGDVLLAVRDIHSGDRVRGVSFEARAGEILGFAGLMGAGRTETMRAIFGADRLDSGTVRFGKQTPPARLRTPGDAVRAGLALLTEDRKTQGLLLPLSVERNLTFPALSQLAGPLGWLAEPVERRQAGPWIERLRIRCHSPAQPVVELSGGNQQKVVIGKWLLRDCRVLIFDEPTRGIDVGARFEIYQLLAELAARGKAVIVVSSDLKELMSISDRIVVMSAGRVTATFRRGEWTEDKILRAAFRGHVRSETAPPPPAP